MIPLFSDTTASAEASCRMDEILDWNGRRIEVCKSKGGVLALADPFANFVRGNVTPWPPPEIAQKLYQSRQARAFDADLQRVQAQLGYYCDLQSIHAEDAMTWSMFGPLVYSPPAKRVDFAQWLFNRISVPSQEDYSAHLWLWRRLPHPDRLVPGGPEIDFGIQTSSTLLLGESKWRSGLGQRQGKDRDKDQKTIRLELVNKYGRVLFPGVKNFVLLFVSPENNEQRDEIDADGTQIFVRHCCWEALCEYPQHPAARELKAYLRWKIQHSQSLPNTR